MNNTQGHKEPDKRNRYYRFMRDFRSKFLVRKCLHSEPLNTMPGCSRHGVVTPRFTLEWPVSVLPLSKTFTLLGLHSYLTHCGQCF
jgi:hypothetical protein